MTEWPALCTSPHCRPPEHGGPRRTEAAWFCPVCVDRLRENLQAIAGMWPDLEEGLGAASGHGSADDGKQHNGRVAIGLVVNEAVSDAMRESTRIVTFTARIILDDADEADRAIVMPASQDTPTIARWIAARWVDHIAHHPGDELAREIVRDVANATRQARNAAYPRFIRTVPTGLPCEAKDDQGVPCTGIMVARLRDTYDGMPDLTCTTDRAHTMPPDVWAREGWRSRHRGMAPGAATRLAQAIVSA